MMERPTSVRLAYTQDVDGDAPSGLLCNDMSVEVVDAGGGHYLVLSTERWTIDPEDIDAFAALLRDALRLCEPEP